MQKGKVDESNQKAQSGEPKEPPDVVVPLAIYRRDKGEVVTSDEVVVQGVPYRYGIWPYCWSVREEKTGADANDPKNGRFDNPVSMFQDLMRREGLLQARIIRTNNADFVAAIFVALAVAALQLAQTFINRGYSSEEPISSNQAANIGITAITAALPMLLAFYSGIITCIRKEANAFAKQSLSIREALADITGHRPIAVGKAVPTQPFLTADMPVFLELSWAAVEKAYGFNKAVVPGSDHNCQFRSLARALLLADEVQYGQITAADQSSLSDEDKAVAQLRARACAYIRNHRFSFARSVAKVDLLNQWRDKSFKDIDDFLVHMEKSGEWGDNLTLAALNADLDKKIYVLYNSGNGKLTVINMAERDNTDRTPENTLVVIYDGSTHYDVVSKQPNQEFFALINKEKNRGYFTIPLVERPAPSLDK